jgi:hypothetical protein
MHVSCFLKKRGGLVITGVSPASIGSTQSGLDVPSFFWKLVCYKDISQTIVVGFIGDNSIVSWKNQQQRDDRKESVQRLLSQREVLGQLGVKYSPLYTTMWFEAQATLKGRKPMLPLNPLECASAQQLPANLQVRLPLIDLKNNCLLNFEHYHLQVFRFVKGKISEHVFES